MRCRGAELELGGVKWWTTGACLPTCAICIFMGKTDAAAAPHKQQSMVLVPMSTPGQCRFAFPASTERNVQGSASRAHARHDSICISILAGFFHALHACSVCSVFAGVTVVRPLDVFGYDAAPHGHAEVHLPVTWGSSSPALAALVLWQAGPTPD